MALTRKMLKGMSLTEEQIDTIIEAHTETTTALKEERDRLEEDAKKYQSALKEIEDLKAKIPEDGKNPFEVKYNAIKEEFEKFKGDIEKKNTKEAKTKAYKDLLKEAGVSEKRFDAIVRCTDLDKEDLADGVFKNKDKLLEGIKSEWADFIEKSEVKGTKTPTPPSNNGGKMTKAEIMKIKDADERQRAIEENHEEFNF